MILALLAIQGIGLVLVGFFAGFVISDYTRPRERRSRVQASAEDGAKPTEGKAI